MSLVDKQLERLRRQELLSENEIRILCAKARDILCEEGTVLRLQAPVTVCGDIHGQFEDLLVLFDVAQRCPATQYLFLGDFVDRGCKSVETFLFLLLLKIRFPDRVFLLRGNHESRQVTMVYGFYDECLRKYGNAMVWRLCCEVFDYLSLGAIVDEETFCVHGGLSPELQTIDRMRLLDRKKEIPHMGPMSDLVWSDPEESIKGWDRNTRGAGYIFGEDVVETFLHTNGLKMVVRAHQLAMEGYKVMFNTKLVTVWSAPDYFGRCKNLASVLALGENKEKEFIVFGKRGALPHLNSSPEVFGYDEGNMKQKMSLLEAPVLEASLKEQ